MKNQFNLLLIIGFICFLAGCASTDDTMGNTHAGKLPKPDHVYVYNFAVSPDEVQFDNGISSDIQQLVNKTPRTDEERTIGHKAANTLAHHLMTEIENLGFLTTRAFGPLPKEGNFLVIRGQFVSIDESNQTAQVVIGLGMGRTNVQVVVQACEYQNGQQMLATQFESNVKSDSSRDITGTTNAGVATGPLVSSAVFSSGLPVGTEEFSANIEAAADRTAKVIANQVKACAIAQGWMEK